MPVIDYKKLYEELIMEVATKHPNETRHQTALRYIRQAESHQDDKFVAKMGEVDRGERSIR